jgi:phosphomannomutase
VAATLQGLGINVVRPGPEHNAYRGAGSARQKSRGGIILTASHNPKQWNALKLLNAQGNLSPTPMGSRCWLWPMRAVQFAVVTKLGQYSTDSTFLKKHIKAI